MQHSRADHAIVFADKYVYVMGGIQYESDMVLKTCERYDLENKTWTFFNSMKLGRSGHTAVADARRIYVSGGYIGYSNLTDSIEYFDMSTDEWYTLGVKLPYAV
mmetsp:Transcript_18983/g.8839  ORF Transcript_18983/g.8839 Transcript_18983/m.8839 type:complete len:104 (-) Transcript_18983:298-609(-)|eukprot:CAMPEP_0201281452 /NCGR_PEP_ID=MMETSP1317-20130820/2755_1 /ASSEMBLY_ACC=CAM_ASM_000770 /TAXON_ID=187299 /ORGANISM="Undescribed Undescribed, Strain Undescribed" /LENGTH=103 /DNA_ID=CAMNT_0047591235 /DNA_START=197 /DNA_END=508 /DNA_ORIENTATION=+